MSFRLLHPTAKIQKSGAQKIVWTYLLPYSLTIYITLLLNYLHSLHMLTLGGSYRAGCSLLL